MFKHLSCSKSLLYYTFERNTQQLNRILLLVFFTCLSPLALQAQFEFGFKAGATLNTISANNAELDGVTYSYGYYSGINFGFFTDMRISQNSALELALNLTQRGYHESASYVSDSLAFNQATNITFFYARIPLSYKHSIPLGKGSLFAKGGMYLGIGLGGRYEASPDIYINQTGVNYINEPYERGVVFAASLHSQTLTNAFYGADLYLNRFDYGANFGFGYRYQKLIFELSYDLGFQNMVPPAAVPIYDSDLRYYNRSLLISAGVYF